MGFTEESTNDHWKRENGCLIGVVQGTVGIELSYERRENI
jgi:hypothetical protein